MILKKFSKILFKPFLNELMLKNIILVRKVASKFDDFLF